MKKETRNLVIFFAATFIWTWVCYTPMAVTGNSPYQMPWMILLILGGAGPSIVGVAMVLLTYKKEQRSEYWSRCFSFTHIPLHWWLVIFLIFPVTIAISVAVDVSMGRSLPGMEQLNSLIRNPVMWPLALFIGFMSGPWSEEFGWRGYALEPITKRLGIIPGTVTLGAVWAVWHLPLFFMPTTWFGKIGFKVAGYGFWMYVVFTIGLALVMTWVIGNTHRSILAGMLLHFTSNFTSNLIAPSSDQVEIVRAIVLLAVGVTGCLIMSRKTHTNELRATKRLQPG